MAVLAWEAMNEPKEAAVIFHGRFPSEKAAALWAGKVAEGFGDQGFETWLIVPRRRGVVGDPFASYHLRSVFRVRTVFTIDLFDTSLLKRIAFAISAVAFSIAALLYLKRHAPSDVIIYSNDPQAMWILSLFYSNCFYELHVVPTDKLFWYRPLFRRMRGFIAITKWGARELEKKFGIQPERIIHAPGGVDVAQFDIPLSKEEARQKLGLPLDKKIALYTGHLYAWKGVDTLAQAAALLPAGVEVIFVGGTEGDVAGFKEKYAKTKNIRIVGQRPHTEIPLWQKAADVLVLPNTAHKRISKYNTSPMKLFEYMASGVPIVASDLPSIREVITEREAILVAPDDPRALAGRITQILSNPSFGKRLGEAARAEVSGYAWSSRGKRITSFVERFC